MDEILDLVDDTDTVIGTIERSRYSELLTNKFGYIRASELFIINSDGKLWIPIRTSDKTIAPNGYDYSAAGHVESGENYYQTIIRETKEELNLDIAGENLELVAKMKSQELRYFRSIYILKSNITPSFNPNDFVSAEWLSPDEIIKNIEAGHPAKQSLVETIITLQQYLRAR